MKKTTIIIPTKNGGKQFKKVLEACLNQKVPWEYDVIVVDSGSTDDTLMYCQRFEDVTVLTIKPEEFGHGRTRNFAISKANSEFVVLITQDALPFDNNWLYELVSAADANPNIAGAFGRHIAYPQSSIFTARDLKLHFDGFAAAPSVVCLDDIHRYENEVGYRQFLHFFSNNNSCLRKDVWNEIPFPEVDFAEDQIWAKKVIEAGYKKAYADKAIVYHSHDFAIWETFRRSFDEASAFYRLFGYILTPNIFSGTAVVFRQSVRDFKCAFESGFTFKGLFQYFQQILINLAK